MLILLPPSEGKAEPAAGDPVDLGSLAFADELSERREAMLDAFDPALRQAPAAPAADVYSGVLFKRLGLPELPVEARDQVLIFSGLWGVLRPDDRIPFYKFPPKTKLKGIGAVAGFWRPALAEALPDEEGELVLDMRSAAYASFWKPQRARARAVRAFTEKEDGERKAVSHMAKAVRGDVARALLEADEKPADSVDLAMIVAGAGFDVEMSYASMDVIFPG